MNKIELNDSLKIFVNGIRLWMILVSMESAYGWIVWRGQATVKIVASRRSSDSAGVVMLFRLLFGLITGSE